MAPLIWGVVLIVVGIGYAFPAAAMWEDNQPNGWSFVWGFFSVSFLSFGGIAIGAYFDLGVS